MYTSRRDPQHSRWRIAVIILIVLVVYIIWALARPLSSATPSINQSALTAQAGKSALKWPSAGQSAVGVVGTSILDMHGNETPVPTASTAKLITALTVLAQKPLQPGEQGPTITLTDSDVALYNNYQALDGSLVKVQAGEQISEYQMLQTMMLPSANNMADSLAIWAFGSLKEYQQAANQELSSLGLVTTHVGTDASGLSPSTTSTAHDMVQIGELVMQNPVLSQIVGQSNATGIPVVGNINNVNKLLGTDNIVGIKTGNSDQAGGAFVSASHTTVNGKQVTIVTALMGAPGLWQAMNDSLPLIQSAQDNFPSVAVVRAGTSVASYSFPWNKNVSAIAQKDLAMQVWGGSTVSARATLKKASQTTSMNQTVGTVTVSKSATNDALSTNVTLSQSPGKPSVPWRLTHPF